MSDNDDTTPKSSGSGGGSDSNNNGGKKRKLDELDETTSTSGGAIQEPSSEVMAKIRETLENEYRDFSHITAHEVNATAVSFKRQQAFPATLHKILSTPMFSNAIVWLPHGRAWKVINQKVFKREVLPSFFNHCSSSSFVRQVNNWNFTRIMSGPDEGAYYHQYFLRGLPHICLLMTSKSQASQGNKRGGHDALARMLNKIIPDFYAFSERHPLPENSPPPSETNIVSGSATSSLATSTDAEFQTMKIDRLEQQQQQKQQNTNVEEPRHSQKQTEESASQPKQNSSSSDDSHSFSSSTIPPKSSSSFSTEEEKNGVAGRSGPSTQPSATASSSATTQSSNQAQSPQNPQQFIIEGRMVNIDGSGITIPSAGILFGGYSMSQYIEQNRYILSRSLYFYPSANNNAGASPQHFNPAVAYPFNASAIPALQVLAQSGGVQGANGNRPIHQHQLSNNTQESKKESSDPSSSENSF